MWRQQFKNPIPHMSIEQGFDATTVPQPVVYLRPRKRRPDVFRAVHPRSRGCAIQGPLSPCRTTNLVDHHWVVVGDAGRCPSVALPRNKSQTAIITLIGCIAFGVTMVMFIKFTSAEQMLHKPLNSTKVGTEGFERIYQVKETSSGELPKARMNVHICPSHAQRHC